MSGRKGGKDGKSGSKGTRSKEKQSEVIDISGEANVVVVVTEEGKDSSGHHKDHEQDTDQSCTFCQGLDNDVVLVSQKKSRIRAGVVPNVLLLPGSSNLFLLL